MHVKGYGGTMKNYLMSLGVGLFLLTACQQHSANKPSSAPLKPQTSQDGVISGGGGKGVKCGDQVTTLDLWEAVEIHGLQLEMELGNLDNELIYHAYGYLKQTQPDWNKLMNVSSQEILAAVKKEIFDKQMFIPQGQRLSFTNDATLPVLKPGCEFIQIAVYADDGKIYFDREYWELLKPQAQASLIFHELAYLVSRRFGTLNSDEARTVIGKIFSTSAIIPNFPDSNGRRAWCGAGGGQNRAETFEIYFYEEIQNGVSGVGAYFFALKNEYMLTQTYGFLPNVSLDQIGRGQFPSLQIPIRNTTRKTSMTFEIGRGRSPFVRAWKSGDAVPVESWAVCANR